MICKKWFTLLTEYYWFTEISTHANKPITRFVVGIKNNTVVRQALKLRGAGNRMKLYMCVLKLNHIMNHTKCM